MEAARKNKTRYHLVSLTDSPRESESPAGGPKNGPTVSRRESVKLKNADSRTHLVRHL